MKTVRIFCVALTLTLAQVAFANCPAINLSDLSGSITSVSEGTVTITNNSAACTYQVGLASYEKRGPILANQYLFSYQSVQLGPQQSVSLKVAIPNCSYQLDLVNGPILQNFHSHSYGKYFWDVERKVDHANTYGPYCVGQ